MALESFNAYHSYLESMELLSDEEAGRLFRACLSYSQSGEAQELRGNERFVFPAMRAQIDRDRQKYTDKCRKNAENIRARWETTDEYDSGEESGADTDADKDMDKEKDKTKTKDKDKTKKSDKDRDKTGERKRPVGRFVPPSLEEVEEYVKQRNSCVDAQDFVDFYAKKGWLVGKTGMKDWRAACRNAERWERYTDSRPPKDAARKPEKVDMAELQKVMELI